ncbi:MAG: M20/M25/M40 family metallo-hydrolase [Gemmatimonadota bacterium]|nr:M20/M25/M40 family metallo-hydrolase [Gemmatimonadota bacterium]
MVRPLATSLVLSTLLAAPVAGQVPDFDTAGNEAVEILQALIRIDTSNPPGNETLVAQYVEDLLAEEGIQGEIYALDPDRGNLVARLEGNGSKDPILILAHSDVVGVEPELWTGDAFSGEIQDDYVYGRGATDDKDMIAAGVQVMLMLKRQGLTLDRDVILLVEAGEEGSTEFGIDYMVENHLDKIQAEFALNEGGGANLTEGGEVDRVSIGTAEKVPWRQVRLVARGTSGHGSAPRVDNPVVRLAAAVAKIGENQMPKRLNDTTREYFRRLAEISPPELAVFYRNIEDPVLGPVAEEYFRHNDIAANSMLRTSVSPNVIQGGFRYNVIPGEAEATLDVRALPDEDMDAFLAELARRIDDPLVEVMPPVSWRPSGEPSPLDTDLFLALENTQRQMYPEAVTLPMMNTGATDSAQLRAAGIPTYGIGAPSTVDDRRAHGNDERISVQSMHEFVEFIYRTIIDVGGAPIIG